MRGDESANAAATRGRFRRLLVGIGAFAACCAVAALHFTSWVSGAWRFPSLLLRRPRFCGMKIEIENKRDHIEV